jgi:putative spermidine/putrescine transport system permease protein
MSLARLTRRLERWAVHGYVALICAFILAPILIVVVVSFQDARYLAFPIERFSTRWYTAAIIDAQWRAALGQSLLLAVQTTIVATLLGLSAGLAIHYHDFRFKDALSVFFLSPLIMPELLIALSLLFFFANYGLSGTYPALLLGHILVAFPFVVRLVLSALPNARRSLEEAAQVLGANEFTAMFKITLPLIGPAVRGGALFAFIVSYNNVMISLFLSTPRIVPMPIKIFEQLEWIADPTIAAVSTVFLALTFVLMIVLEKTVKLEVIPAMEKLKGRA